MEKVSTNEENKKNIRKNFETELRKNGFGFQYAVIDEITRLYNEDRSAFRTEFAELPVKVDNNTHIDFILERKDTICFPKTTSNSFYLICECKRANPALSTWCFVRSPFGQKDLLIEKLQSEKQWNTIKSYVHFADKQGNEIFDIAFCVKTGEKGEGNTSSVNEAVTQVLRGMNGFIEYLEKKKNLLKIEHIKTYTPYFFPVIFTTAELWTSTIDLGKSDLSSGNIELPIESLCNQPWLLFQYNQSQPIKHTISTDYSSNNIFKIAQTEFTRTVAIVNSKGLGHFLNWITNFSNFV